jgi:general secretion pathway protein A
MYLKHFNLKLMPFNDSPDSQFLWLGEKHKEVLAVLKFGIQENKGFTLLTGSIGSGKTTLVSCLLNQNETDAVMMSIPDPDITVKDFFSLLADEFGFNIDFETRGEFLLKFKNCLNQFRSGQKKVLLTIDEAQRLNHGLLEQIRLLATIETRGIRLFSIILVGQNGLHESVRDIQNRGLPQKIAVHCHIESLTEAETRDYIDHRLQVAASTEEIFSPKAISEIFSFSKGCPRLINTICDRALLTGYARGISQINRKIVKKSADELILPGEKDSRSDRTGAEVKKRNHHESAGETPVPQAGKENNDEQAAEAPVPESETEQNREAAVGAPEKEGNRDTHCDATEQNPRAGAAGPVEFTWGPGAKPKLLRVSVKDQELPTRDKSTRSPRTIMIAVAILMLSAVAFYLWLGA